MVQNGLTVSGSGHLPASLTVLVHHQYFYSIDYDNSQYYFHKVIRNLQSCLWMQLFTSKQPDRLNQKPKSQRPHLD